MYVQALLLYLPSEMEKCDSKYCSCLYFSANALSRIMTKMADESFAVNGLTSSYAFLLMTVNKQPGIQPKEISLLMQLTPSTVSRLIEKMEHRELLVRKSIGRNTEVYPTQASLDLNESIKGAWDKLYKKYSNILGQKEGDELAKLIHEAAKKLE